LFSRGSPSLDYQIRIAAFEWLSEQTSIHGEVIPPPKGIHKPQILEIPLSMTTAPKGPYNDGYDKEKGIILYKYRGNDPSHPDNVGLRKVYQNGIPLVYFHGIMPGKYMAVWPVYIVGDDPTNLTFHIAVDDQSSLKYPKSETFEVYDQGAESRRLYITATVRKRLHQRSFRERVLKAYREQCSLCRLRHLELLDAAHIIPDSNPEGEPNINNGIALCKLHHAAFDSFIIGITPDYTIVVREDILEEEDGPMLQHGLKKLHSQRIILPGSKNNWPDQDLLDKRYQKFKQAI
jgi:putative restriction endonuclease